MKWKPMFTQKPACKRSQRFYVKPLEPENYPNGSTVVHPHNRIRLGDKKEQTTHLHNTDESQTRSAKWKEPVDTEWFLSRDGLATGAARRPERNGGWQGGGLATREHGEGGTGRGDGATGRRDCCPSWLSQWKRDCVHLPKPPKLYPTEDTLWCG